MTDIELMGKYFGELLRSAKKDILAEASATITALRSEISSLEAEVAAIKSDRDDFDVKSIISDEVERSSKVLGALIQSEVGLAMHSIPLPKDGKDGKSVDVTDVELMVESAVKRAVDAIPTPKDGKDGQSVSIDEVVKGIVDSELFQRQIDEKIALVEKSIKQPISDSLSSDVVKMVSDAISSMKSEVKTAIESIPTPKDGKDGSSVTVSDIEPIIAKEIERAIAAIPKPLDGIGMAGGMIDVEGNLIITTTKGDTLRLGKVVGSNGINGRDGVDGKDGIGLDSFDIKYLSETHEVELTLKSATMQKSIRYDAGGIRPAGYWREGTSAKACEAWTHDGSLWVAHVDTKSKPSTSNSDWTLIARKGRDGETVRYKEPTPIDSVKLGKQ